jgi:hypothetical protein
MKAKDIIVGGKYRAKISGRLTTVRVDATRIIHRIAGVTYGGSTIYRDAVVYDVTNLTTGRKTTFRSAAKFRGEADVATVNMRQGREEVARHSEPKGYDEVNQATHEHKEAIKVGYNLRRKVVLLAIWLLLPLVLLLDPTLLGWVDPHRDARDGSRQGGGC